MSDYQMQVCEEDFPDVMLPSPGSHAGGDANSVVALEDNIMDNGSVSGPSAASMFGIDNGVPPPPQQTFANVQGHFRDVFKTLFEGGDAELRAVGEDPLECEIEIVAKPRGKHLQSISLMSGGERALTAIALTASPAAT